MAKSNALSPGIYIYKIYENLILTYKTDYLDTLFENDDWIEIEGIGSFYLEGTSNEDLEIKPIDNTKYLPKFEQGKFLYVKNNSANDVVIFNDKGTISNDLNWIPHNSNLDGYYKEVKKILMDSLLYGTGLGKVEWEGNGLQPPHVYTNKCECGSEHLGSPKHSSYCPKFTKDL